MAVVVESAATSTGASSTDCVIPKPSGLAVGDLLVAHIFFRANTTNISPPADWAEIVAIPGPLGDFSMEAFWKIADADDVAATDFTFTTGSTVSRMGGILRISGHDATTPINASNQAEGASTTSVDAACGVTPSVADCLLIICHSANDDIGAVSAYAIATDNPATWTEQYDAGTNAGGDCLVACATATRPETTATGNVSYTLAAPQKWGTFLIAIAPSAGGGGGGTILPQIMAQYYS